MEFASTHDMLFPVTPHAVPAHESRLMMETAFKKDLFFSTAATVSGQVGTRKELLPSPCADAELLSEAADLASGVESGHLRCCDLKRFADSIF